MPKNRDTLVLPMSLIDSHIHLDFPVFDGQRAKWLDEARQAGIRQFVVPATTAASWQGIADLATQENIAPAYGLHPYFVADHHEADLEKLDHWLAQNPSVAVGEIGLDFFLKDLDRAHQQFFFEQQLRLAQKHALPAILHARKAIEAVTLALKKTPVVAGIVHSYNGSLQQAHQLVDMGFKLGFGGAITYPRATKLRQLISDLPLEAIVLETDAPDQPPADWPDAHNTPLGLHKVFEAVCQLRPETPEEIARQTRQNVHQALPGLV